MNESDVRENILAPFIRALGYRLGTSANVTTELSLTYPRISFGTKKTSKDPVLRGRADYLLEVDGRLRWVIEAKGGAQTLGIDEIEQAYTYANHPEVRAIYFMVSNGHRLLLFQTNQGPRAAPILDLKYEELNSKFQVIANVVRPEALRRDYPTYVLDVGIPLAPGLRSFAQIVSGKISYTANSMQLHSLKGLTVRVVDGTLQRMEGGGILAYIRTEGAYEQSTKLSQLLGADWFEMFSEEEFISIEEAKSTMFRGRNDYIIPANAVMHNPAGADVTLPFDNPVFTELEANCYLVEARRLVGISSAITTMPKMQVPPIHSKVTFELFLS